MTLQELIDKALTEIHVIEAGDTANSTDSEDALDDLNQMLAAWSVTDKNLQIPPMDTLGDTIPLPTWAVEGVIANLAETTAATFSAVVPDRVSRLAHNGRNTILRVLIRNKMKGADMSHLPLGRYLQSNILTGP